MNERQGDAEPDLVSSDGVMGREAADEAADGSEGKDA